MTSRWIAIDYDGVINGYQSGYGKGDLPDPPVLGAFDFLKQAIGQGYNVVIHSTRFKDQEQIGRVQRWFLKHGFESNWLDALTFTAIKPNAEVYIDDRAWRFEGTFPPLSELMNLVPWHKKPRVREVPEDTLREAREALQRHAAGCTVTSERELLYQLATEL